MLKNLRIRQKLLALLAVAVIAMLTIGAMGGRGIKLVGDALDEVGLVRMPSVEGLLILSEAQTAVKAASLSALMFQGAHFREGLPGVMQARRNAWASADAGWKLYEPLPQTPEEAQLWKQFVQEWDRWKAADVGLEKTIAALAASSTQEQTTEQVEQFLTKYQASVPLFVQAEATLLKIIRLNQKIAAESVSAGHAATAQALWSMLAVAIIAVFAMLTFALYVNASITTPIQQAVAHAQAVAAGDLTRHIEASSRDETGQLLEALRNMKDNLADIVGNVRTGTDTIATAAGQIAAGNLDLSSRTEEQASSLEETASSMEELTSTVRQNADNARQANALALTASEIASRGGAVVGQMIETMGGINDSSRKISDIITVIDSIAFQTNILALNAAVEAARAGEQGRGFAVVAREVRNLAQRSAAAAKEIKTLINGSVEQVEAGGQLVNRAGTTMQEVVTSIKRVSDVMAEIMAASQEQSLGIEQINQAIVQMDEVTQQNAALVEEAAAASASMQEQSGHLSGLVAVFKTHQVGNAAPKVKGRQPSSAHQFDGGRIGHRGVALRELDRH